MGCSLRFDWYLLYKYQQNIVFLTSNNVLKIIYWNGNGISNKKDEFFNYLLKKDIHIAAISETFLKNGTRFSHPNYHTYRLYRTQGEKGGVALVISKAINHEVNSDYKLKVIEAIGITIKTQNSKVTIISIYNPGSNDDHSSFRKDITKLSKISNHFIICGGFNARHRFWNCSKANQMGKPFSRKIKEENFLLFILKSTPIFQMTQTVSPQP